MENLIGLEIFKVFVKGGALGKDGSNRVVFISGYKKEYKLDKIYTHEDLIKRNKKGYFVSKWYEVNPFDFETIKKMSKKESSKRFLLENSEVEENKKWIYESPIRKSGYLPRFLDRKLFEYYLDYGIYFRDQGDIWEFEQSVKRPLNEEEVKEVKERILAESEYHEKIKNL